jgi:hypothetical protein
VYDPKLIHAVTRDACGAVAEDSAVRLARTLRRLAPVEISQSCRRRACDDRGRLWRAEQGLGERSVLALTGFLHSTSVIVCETAGSPWRKKVQRRPFA